MPGATFAVNGPTRAVVHDYVGLTKPRIIELLLVTTVPAMMCAAHGMPPAGTAIATLVGGSLAAGSANALNCVIDRDIDSVMHRTASRTAEPRAGRAADALCSASSWECWPRCSWR